MTRYLVTGAAGFIGSHVVRQLLDDGATVRGLDALTDDLTPSADKRRRIASLAAVPGFEFARSDLRRDDLAEHLDGVDGVIHLAALAGLPSPQRPPRSYHEHNVRGTRRLLDALAGRGVHLVHASTSSVYGRNAVGDESQPLLPVSEYGRSKVAAEGLILERAGTVDATILRLFSVYGPDQRSDMAYAIACRRLLAGEPMFVTGDGRQSRSNTHVTDVARAIVRAAALRPGGVMNIAGGEEIALIDAITVLADRLGVSARIEHAPPREGDQRETRGDSSLAAEVLEWRPVVGIEEGLAAQADWFRRHLAG